MDVVRLVLEEQLKAIIREVNKAIEDVQKAEKKLMNSMEELNEIMEAIGYFNKKL